MTVTYEQLPKDQDTFHMMFCFVFNDIFGHSTLSDFVEFEL